MNKRRFGFAFDFWNDALRQYLAHFDSPFIANDRSLWQILSAGKSNWRRRRLSTFLQRNTVVARLVRSAGIESINFPQIMQRAVLVVR